MIPPRLVVCLLALAAPVIAIDRIVDRNNPTVYQTLQDALDASNPGDRILLRTDDFGRMQRWNTVAVSVTIRGEGGALTVLGQPALEIAGLTPGIPFRIENLVIRCHSTGMVPRAAVFSPTGVILAGEVIFDGVEVRTTSDAYDVAHGIDLHARRLSLHDTRIVVADTPNNNACCEELYRRGSDALRFAGTDLYIEDSVLVAGSANLLNYYPNCFALCPEAGSGGAALLADSRTTVAVRSTMSDGNGGSVQANANWPRAPSPGPAGASQLVGTTGLLAAYACTQQLGLADRGGPGLTRGGTVRVGIPQAALSVGQARLGQPVTFTVAFDPTAASLAMLLGFERAPLSTPFGTLHIAPALLGAVLPFPSQGTATLGVPNNPALLGVALVAQHAFALNTSPMVPLLGNPSTTWFSQ